MGGTIGVVAHSEADESIQVMRGAAAGIATSTLRGDKGNYFRIATFTGEVPTEIVVQNAGDVPVSRTSAPLVETDYDAEARPLTVSARSSDLAVPPTLTVTGLGPMTGTQTVFENVDVPPLTVEVISSAGGRVTRAPAVGGAGFGAVPLQAAPMAPASVPLGAQVTLDGSASTGDINSYAWTRTAGLPVALTGADTAKATFPAPTVPASLTFLLTVTGPGPLRSR